MGYRFTRREFLKGLSLATVATSIPSIHSFAADNNHTESHRSKKVVIIGAGLAGLAAAYELLKRRHEVIILEAQSNPGGRIQTLYRPFANGRYAEAGALSVPSGHSFTLGYIAEFGLRLDIQSPSPELKTVYFIRGNRIAARPDEQVNWPLNLTQEEQSLGIFGIIDKYILSVSRNLGDASAPNWPPASLKYLDQMTFTKFLQLQGASPDAINLIKLQYFETFGDGFDSVSALALLRDLSLTPPDTTINYQISGGNSKLPKAFANRIGKRVIYNATVKKILQTSSNIQLSFIYNGKMENIAADYLVCAVPFSVLKQIEILPHFSASKERAINELPYTSVTRTFLQTKNDFWINAGLNGYANTDLTMMLGGNNTLALPGPHSILESYTAGRHARFLAGLNTNERIQHILSQMDVVLPGTRANFELGVSKVWDKDPFAVGAYSYLRPGQLSTLYPFTYIPEGRVHFAGEHTSPWPGWMQGALHSAIRVAHEINNAN